MKAALFAALVLLAGILAGGDSAGWVPHAEPGAVAATVAVAVASGCGAVLVCALVGGAAVAVGLLGLGLFALWCPQERKCPTRR